MSIFGYPMDSWVHTGTLVFLSLRANEHRGGDLREIALKDRVDHIIGQAGRHSELPRPNGWCPFSGTLWTHESTQVLWCSWVLGQMSTAGAIPWNSVKSLITILGKLNAIVNCRVPMADIFLGVPYESTQVTILGKLNAIVNCRVPMADVHFRVPYGLMSPHRYFGVPES